MRKRHALTGILLAAVGGVAIAQVPIGPAPEPTLHVYVDGPTSRTGEPVRAKVVGSPPSAGQNPTAIRDRGKLLPEPSKKKDRQPREPVFGQGGFAADRKTEAPPDRQTGADGTLRYTEVFNPAIVPFKRMTALDAARDDYMLYIYDQSLTALEVGGENTPDRDLFWGSLMIEISPGEEIPIPSMAPDMRILSYEMEPPLELAFSKDQADNFYVRSDDPRADGQYRLVFLADAPASYFASGVPRGKTLRDAAASGLVRPLPPRARYAAARMHERLGLHANTPLDVAVDKLVSWFRAFEAGEAPNPNGPSDDIYLDLAFSQVGVCRHRSFAFVITANALGIPARYVTNEAHAFVEIWVPDVGWVRIDLGGAALELDVSNALDKQMYRPRGDDPFPQPRQYANNYTRMNGLVNGLSDSQKDDVRRPADDDPNGLNDPSGLNGKTPPGVKDPRTDPLSPSPGSNLPKLPPSAYAGKELVEVLVGSVDAVGFRGEEVRVSGGIASAGRGVAGLPVDLYFSPAGMAGDGARLMGQTVTSADGTFSYSIELPKDLPLQRYEVFAATPGDATHAPGLSE